MPTIALRYDGNGSFKALGRFAKQCEAMLKPGEFSTWERVEIRSVESHHHFFAAIQTAWETLPESLGDEFPSADHLRKWALCKAGYCSQTRIVVKTNDEAVKLVTAVKRLDNFAVVSFEDRTVTICQAESMTYKAMGKAKFQRAKEDCLRVISELLGAEVREAA